MALAFGNVENTDWKFTDSGGVASSVTVPLVTFSNGNLGVIVVYVGATAVTFNTVTGWAKSYQGDSTEGVVAIFTRNCDGSETSTVNISIASGSYWFHAISLKLTGHDTTTPINTTAAANVSGGSNWNSPSITTTVNGCILFFGGGSAGTAGTFDSGDEPDTTTLIKQWASSAKWLGLAYETQTTAGATGTRLWTNPTNTKRAFSFAIAPASASGLTITSVTPSQIDSGESFTINGSGFGATQGLSLVQIGGVTQTPTSWSDTSITCTATRGSQSMGNATLTIYKM